MKTIVITGALGHIGSRLIRDLAQGVSKSQPGFEIRMLDNMAAQRYCSLFHLPEGPRYRFFESDILKADLAPLLHGADALVHLAAITNAADSFENAQEVERVNLAGAERIARACAEAGVPMLFPSTTSVYGTQEALVDENCSEDELKPQSPYADSKIKAERMLERLGREAGLKFITCRFGTIYGVSPGMRFHTAVNKFSWQAVMGKPVTVWRTALHQYRPYLELGDACRSIQWILDNNLFDGQVYNVLTNNETVDSILNVIREKVPGLKVDLVDTKIMNQLSYKVANEKFKAKGFEFNGRLREGIHETLAWISSANYIG